MNDETLRRMAHRRAGFKRDFFAYLFVMAFLLLINLTRSPEHLWVIWPAIGWGIGLAFHAWSAYGPDRGTLEDTEYRKLKAKYAKKEE